MLVHLMGICGTGMGSFAGLLKAAGHNVRGSDSGVYPPMSTKLAQWGIPTHDGYAPNNLTPTPDLVVVGNVIRRDNPEAEAVLAQGLNYKSFPAALSELFLTGKHSVVVSGTHGKTTTSSLAAWVLHETGQNPGMLIGGVPDNFDEGFRLGGDTFFVVEGDEYDTAFFDKVPKFLHYQPRSLFVTSIEFDHADIYDSLEQIEAQFRKVTALVPKEGAVYVCADSQTVLNNTANAQAKIIRYSVEGNTADYSADNIRNHEDGVDFDAKAGALALGRFRLGLSGKHNVANALAVIAFAHKNGLDMEKVQKAVASFRGVQRRQTLRATIAGIRIIDDFAHHPTAVAGTVRAVRERFAEGRLFAIFEPRTATSSRKFFQDAYASAFAGADEVIVAGVGRRKLPEDEKLNTASLAASISASGVRARHIDHVDDIVETLRTEAACGDTLLFMSNGGFGGIYEKIEAALND